jgi:hypothetical protein
VEHWLPRDAESDLFHPSLEDLRARNVRGWRLRAATVALWLDCWRVWLVMREGGGITGAGVIAGLAMGLFAARSLSAVLYGVPPTDPLSLLTAAVVLSVAGMAACYIPARRASRVDPARTLTTE